MRPIPFAAVVAVLVACSPRVPSAQEVPIRYGGYSVAAVDESGRTLPTFEHRGRTYVLGALGQRYLLRFRNDTARRVEVVASVDGRDVVDGRSASFAKRGYIVEPHGELTVDGFRTSAEAIAAFRFSSVSRSYAARKGDARDVGVVGLAVFPERPPRWVPPPPQWYPAPRPYPQDQAPGARSEAAPPPSETEGRGGAKAPPSAAPSAPDSGAMARKSERPGLGTEFGEEHASHVERTTFERASARPETVLTFRYDDREGLLALGIDVDGRGSPRDDAWRREHASPFRADASYCEPPPGWRPGAR
jgi:hypothetical protein